MPPFVIEFIIIINISESLSSSISMIKYGIIWSMFNAFCPSDIICMRSMVFMFEFDDDSESIKSIGSS